MNRLLILMVLLLASACAGSTTRNTRSAAEKALDYTVLVQTIGGRTFCSATVIKRTKLLISAWHCFEDGEDFQLSNNKNVFHADIVAVDQLNDIAVLRPFDFQYRKRDGVTLARKAPRIGDTVFSLGHAYGDQFPFTLTAGIVSHSRRVDQRRAFMQTTTPLMGGMSGGGTYNTRGELVGINLFHLLEPVDCLLPCAGVYTRAPVSGHAHLYNVQHALTAAH